MSLQRVHSLPAMGLLLTLTLAALAIPQASAQTYTDLHDFDSLSLSSPQYPGIMAQGRDGNLYGTAPLGGDFGRGGIFMTTPAGAYTVLHSFDSTQANPYSGLTLGRDGDFYGTTFNGGPSSFGTIFKTTPAGALTQLHIFSYVEGIHPYAPPIQGTDGNFYGTTTGGGTGYGTVYKISSGGAFTTLHVFDNAHGRSPIAPLVQGKDGSFYGTTEVGGTSGLGTAFKMTPAGVFTVLYNFDNTHGANPYAPLIQGDDGYFYGTARNGGTLNNGGVAFKMTAGGVLTVLHNFDATGATKDGTLPYAGLTQCSCASVPLQFAYYGVTSAGGTNRLGALYWVDALGNYSVVYNFSQTTGSVPFATLRQHTNGLFYGEANAGGAAGNGTLFSNDLGFQPFPAFAFINPLSSAGKVGQSTEILGTYLSGTTAVYFGAVPASFTIVSDSYMTAKVPAGALTDIIGILLTGNKVLRSKAKFRVTPVILSFAPPSGPVGTAVIITGNSLTQATKVMFGSVAAKTFVVNSDTQITATVPTGAITGKIKVITPGGTATSPTAFTVN